MKRGMKRREEKKGRGNSMKEGGSLGGVERHAGKLGKRRRRRRVCRGGAQWRGTERQPPATPASETRKSGGTNYCICNPSF